MSETVWKEVQTLDDLPTDETKTYLCRMHSGRECPLQFRNGNWVTWASFRNPDISPFAIVAAYAPYVPKTPQTPEAKREYNKRKWREQKERREREHQEWIAAGKPKARLLKRKSAD